MIIHIVRALYLLMVLALTVSYAFKYQVYNQGVTYITFYILIPPVAAFTLVMIDMFWRKKRLQALTGLFFGTLVGLVIAYVMSQIITLAASVFVASPQAIERAETSVRTEAPPAETPRQTEAADPDGDGTGPATELVKVLLGTSAVFFCITIVMQTKDDFRFVIPYVEFSKQTKGARQIILDTSVIIDGRIADIAETGILESELLVPRFVLAELQAIADSEDKLKRNRGRRGLDILHRLQNSEKIDIQIFDGHIQSVDDAPDVDAKLLALSKHLNARAVTNDYNLNKIAKLRNVDVININDLANALKPVVLPGETLTVKVIKPGEEPGQGIGYLEDGTMIVAEQGRDYIGREIVIMVTSVLQTSAGRMIFGKLDADRTLSSHSRNS